MSSPLPPPPASGVTVPVSVQGGKNPFDGLAQIQLKEMKQPQSTNASGASATAPTATPTTTSTPVSTSAPAPISRPYNPNAALSQLDALALPDETENDRLSKDLTTNVANLMATKQENERKQQKVGSALASKARQIEEEQRKLAFIRNELAKLDHSLSRNIDMLRAEIEACGREVNSLQKDFDWVR